MKNPILLIAILAASSVAAQVLPPTAPTPSSPATPSGAPTPQFNESDVVPESPGYEDAFALYEVKVGGQPLSEADQITRWQDELKAGRARAGTLVGSHLAYLALTPADCDAARETLTRADELGSDQAAWKLAQLADNASCGEADVAALERWLKEAVTLDYLLAAQRLISLYSPTGARSDPVQRYVYARMAAGYWQAVYPNDTSDISRTGFDAAALQEMEKELSAADRKRADSEATVILTQTLKRRERFKPQPPQEFARGGQNAKSSKGWGFSASTVDYHHECAWNLAGNCRGAQRGVARQGLRDANGRHTFARSARRSQGDAAPDPGRRIPGARQRRDRRELQDHSKACRERHGRQVSREARRHHRCAAVLSDLRQTARYRGRCGRALLDCHQQRQSCGRRNRALQRLPGARRCGDRHDPQRSLQERLRLWPRQYPHRIQAAGLTTSRCSTSSSSSRRFRRTRATSSACRRIPALHCT